MSAFCYFNCLPIFSNKINWDEIIIYIYEIAKEFSFVSVYNFASFCYEVENYFTFFLFLETRCPK